MEFPRKLAVKLSCLDEKCQELLIPRLGSSTLGAARCTKPPVYIVLLQLCFLLIHPLGKLCYGLVAIVQVYWSQEIWDVTQVACPLQPGLLLEK